MIEIQCERMRGMALRYRTHAVRTQHPGRVEHACEDAFEFVRIDEREANAILDSDVCHVGEPAQQIRAIFEKPTKAFGKILVTKQIGSMADCDREDRNETGDRLRLDRK